MAGLLLALALAFTWPLGGSLTSSIPYVCHNGPEVSHYVVAGDQLQIYYWFWLLVDNIFGPSSLFTNPYEFNTFLSDGLKNYANFPFSLLFLALRPLGAVLAYNLLFLLSYVLSGLFTYLLTRDLFQNRAAALFAALFFALFPSRSKWAYGGHLFGFVAFLLPLILWCLERTLRRRSPWWAAGAGVALVATSLMEPHLFYYSALLLSLYLPLRLGLLGAEDTHQAGEGDPAGAWWEPLLVLAGGLGLGTALCLLHYTGPLGRNLAGHPLTFLVGLAVIWLLGWLVLAWLTTSFTRLSPGRARRVWALGLAGFGVLGLDPLLSPLGLPYTGTTLAGLAGLFCLGVVGRAVWRQGRSPWQVGSLVRSLWPLALALLLAVGYLMLTKYLYMEVSIVSQGRPLYEVVANSYGLEKLSDLSSRGLLGGLLPLLAVGSLVLLSLGRPRPARGGALASLFALLGAVFLLLSLGPKVPGLPLYEWLYDNLPYFNFPRVPTRMAVFAGLLLSLVAAWLLAASWTRLWRSRRAAGWAVVGLVVLVAADLWPHCHAGLSYIPPVSDLDRLITKIVGRGPQAGHRLLYLPLYKGDQHRASLYELATTRTGVVMVNGYSPYVPLSYLEQIYTPLSDLNVGVVSPRALACLDRLGVNLVALDENPQLFNNNISYFPSALTRRRLLASGLGQVAAEQANLWLFRVPSPPPEVRETPGITSPVTLMLEAEQLYAMPGTLKDCSDASGREGCNVVGLPAGHQQRGELAWGPYRLFPSGDYVARFRLRRGPGPVPGRVDVVSEKGSQIHARLELTPDVLLPHGGWHDVRLPFHLAKPAVLEFRTYVYGQTALDLDLVLINFASQEFPRFFYPASELWRHTGELLKDSRLESGLAVLADPARHPHGTLMTGPQQTLGPGRYRTHFLLAGENCFGPDAVAAVVKVVTARRNADPGVEDSNGMLAERVVYGRELSREYRGFALEFQVKEVCEINLEVHYEGGCVLRLAGASLQSAQGHEQAGWVNVH
ncbi:MAG: YfhO family protein [Deltaproteobacteria bacterium]|nr:YfhO family protein [Deltaproteobacteria bacterium]